MIKHVPWVLVITFVLAPLLSGAVFGATSAVVENDRRGKAETRAPVSEAKRDSSEGYGRWGDAVEAEEEDEEEGDEKKLESTLLKEGGSSESRGNVQVSSKKDGREIRAVENVKEMSLIVRELSELKEAVSGLKVQNNNLYKQMKSFHKACSSSSSSSLSSSSPFAPSGVDPETMHPINNAILSDSLRLNPPHPKTPCPEEFTFYPDYNACYKLSAERVTWRVARDRCLLQHGDLVSVDSSRKQRFFAERAKSNPETRHCDFWIGLSRQSTSLTGWRWSVNDQTLSFTNWNLYEPNNGKGNEHCVQMLWIFHWKWNDASCNYGNACYICQAQSYA